MASTAIDATFGIVDGTSESAVEGDGNRLFWYSLYQRPYLGELPPCLSE